MKKIIFAILFLTLILFIGFILFRTFNFSKNKVDINKENLKVDVDNDSVEHLLKSVKIPVITLSDYKNSDFKKHIEFKEFLETAYPNVFNNLEFMTVNYYSFLLKWKGSDSNLAPVLFTGHYDVVGADETSLKDWKYPPFEGKVEGDKIFGRGTLDDRGSVIAMFEAVEKLIKEGFSPQRDIYFAIGHDEETGGINGAKAISEYFYDNNIKPEMVLDEGGRVEIKNNKQNAYIGISEKGRLLVNIEFKSEGAHASRPPKMTSVVKLAKAIELLNKHQSKPVLIPQVKEYYRTTYNDRNFITRILIANSDILEFFLFKELEKNPLDNAYIRSTTAITKLKGSDFANAIPSKAVLTLDSRILPTQTPEDMLEHIKYVLNKEFREDEYKIEIVSKSNPSNISNTDNEIFKKLSLEIKTMFPSANIVPYMIPAGTDAKHYEKISNNVYRFLPISIKPEEYSLMHGVNEYLSIDNYSRMIAFYKSFIKNNF